CLARVLERAGLFERCEEQYRRVLGSGHGPVRTASLLRLAARSRRRGDLETARRHWEEAAAEGDWLALRALALHHEHRSHDLTTALQAVETGLSSLDGDTRPELHRARADFLR